MCVLHRTKATNQTSDIKTLMWAHLDLWEQGRYDALVRDVETSNLEKGPGPAHTGGEFDIEKGGRRYDHLVKSGKIRQAVRTVTDRTPGGLLQLSS